MSLPTKDLLGVELMSVGGPFKGRGSPPEGDHYSEDDLAKIAADTTTVLDEIKPFNKIGHNPAQALARRSGFYDDDQPETGRWTNFRVEGGKLKADVLGVPEKLARLIEARAFGKRSVEMVPYESQTGKGKFDRVIRAVAWLGAKAPGIKTLDDVVALYGDDEFADGDEAVVTFEYEEAPAATLDLRVDLSTEDDREMDDSADTRGEMADTKTEPKISLDDEQAANLAEALGVDGDLDADTLIAKVTEMRQLADESDPDPDPDPDDEDDEGKKSEPVVPAGSRLMDEADYQDLLARANAGASAAERLRKKDREDLLTAAMSAGKIDPAQHDEFARLYDENPDFVERTIEALPVNNERAAIYGNENERQPSAEDEALYREFSDFTKVDPIEIAGDDA